ncbi:muscarinic acetylcholine receptor DM1-like [Lytechinus variegatus]|uniref:muscarinic acetylcholine receptor DM1-like n=1 Tax=Lytechinus variegatus TaxID=7654 RepID=UPI001BB22A96|nr:muscarinic acetylcholine receptor DM1-like [Lytechinus variegatus]
MLHLIMASFNTQSYSTDIVLSDAQSTTPHSLDSSGTSPEDLRSLIFSAIFFALIVIANIISLGAFMVEKRLRTYNNYFIINLTILDLLVGIVLGTVIEYSYIKRYPFSQNVCKIMTGIFNGIVNASNITVVVICADRHQAIYDPINHFISRSKRKAIIINSLPWVIGLSFWIGYVTVWEFVVDYDNGPHCLQLYLKSPITNVIQVVAKFFLPLAVIAVLYFRIYRKIRKTVGRRGKIKRSDGLTDINLSTTDVSGVRVISSSLEVSLDNIAEPRSRDDTIVSPSNDEGKIGDRSQELSKSNSNRMESTAETTKAIRTLLLIVITFVVTWIPVSVLNLIYSFEPRLVLPGLPIEAFTTILNLQYGNSLLNPLSYAMSQPLFRETIVRMFTCRGCRRLSRAN